MKSTVFYENDSNVVYIHSSGMFKAEHNLFTRDMMDKDDITWMNQMYITRR